MGHNHINRPVYYLVEMIILTEQRIHSLPHFAAPSRRHELCGAVPAGRAALPAAASRQLHLHHQHRPQPRRHRLRGRRMQVPQVRLSYIQFLKDTHLKF